MGLDVILANLQIRGGGYAIIPFGFVINGTSDPDGLTCGTLASTVLSEAGEVLCTLDSSLGKPVSCVYATAALSNTADDVDLYCKVDFSTVASAGTFVVRFMTGATQTNPTDNTNVGGFLLVRFTDRAL